MEREAFLYVKAKLLNSGIANRKNFGSGKVHFNLTGTYMNDPKAPPSWIDSPRITRVHSQQTAAVGCDQYNCGNYSTCTAGETGLVPDPFCPPAP